MSLMMKLVRESACSLLLVTHNHEMAGFADRRLQLEGGRIRESVSS
jgi:predicted ABC-type transport system involved in lysophospholipase L1 biosynthesis ATPase subunit